MSNVEISGNSRWHKLRDWWTLKHSIAAACLAGALLVAGIIGLNITAGRAVQNYTTASETSQSELRQRLTELGELSKKTNPAKKAEVADLHDQLLKTQHSIARTKVPTLESVQFGAQLNPAYRDANQHQFAVSLQELQAVLAQLVSFSEYQTLLQTVMSKPALTAPIKGDTDATKLHDAWVQAAKELRTLKTDAAGLRAATDKMATDAERTAAYAEIIAGYYKENKYKELESSEKELEKLMQTVRGNAELLEDEGRKLHAAVAEIMAQLQQM